MARFAFVYTVLAVLNMVVAIALVVAVGVFAKGRARLLGGAGALALLISGVITPVAGLLPINSGAVFAVLQVLSGLIGTAGIVLLGAGLIVASRATSRPTESGGGWNQHNQGQMPPQSYNPPQGPGPQNFQQWGR